MLLVIRLSLFLLAFLAPSPVGLAQRLNAQVTEKCSIPTEDGAFEFNNLTLVNDSFPYLRGEVVNKTGRDWIEVRFEIIVYDKNGNTIPGLLYSKPMFTVRGFKRNAVRSLGATSKGEMVEVKPNIKALQYDLRLEGGTYETQYIVAMVKPIQSQDLTFEDDSISISWVFDKRALRFVLRNKTDNPIKIDWNQVSYIDIGGSAQKVMHKGVKYMNRNDPQVPTLIPPAAKIEDIVFPTESVYYTSGRLSGGWHERPMFPNGGEAKDYKGKSFSIFMPLEINGAVKNYTFTIQVVDVKY